MEERIEYLEKILKTTTPRRSVDQALLAVIGGAILFRAGYDLAMQNSPRITVTQTQEPIVKEENISTKIIRLENHLRKSLREPETQIELYSQSDDAEMILNYITQEKSIASRVLSYTWKKTGDEMTFSPGNFLSPPYGSPFRPNSWAPPLAYHV